MVETLPEIGQVFTFDAQAHVYYLDGVRIPGVTTILKEAGLVPNYGGFGQAQHRGLHVHSACEFLDLNDLDWSSVYPEYQDYVRAYQRFLEESGFKPELIEFQGFHPGYRFAGTLDRVGQMNGERWVLDIKTGGAAEWHHLQTAGYQLLREEWSEYRRGSVYLNENGSYNFKEHDDPSDGQVFLAALALFHWKANHKIKETQA